MEEQEKKGIKIRLSSVFLVVLLTIVLTTAIIVGVYFLLVKPSQNTANTIKNESVNNIAVNQTENTIANTTKNNTTNSTINNVFENYMDKSLKPTKRFAVSKVEEANDSYILSIYLLKDEYELISKETHDKILNNGGTISFRGKEYKFCKNYESYGEEYGFISLTDVTDVTGSESSLGIIKYNSGYTFYNFVGKETLVKEYTSTEPIKIKVKKDVKVGDAFEKFDYEKSTGEVYVKNYMNERISEDEAYAKKFISNLILNPLTNYGECIAYLLDDEVVAIQTFTASAP